MPAAPPRRCTPPAGPGDRFVPARGPLGGFAAATSSEAEPGLTEWYLLTLARAV